MRETLRQIGRAIKNGSVYPPIRNHAAAVATLAPPKDFVAQLNCIYQDFIHRWRYVKDPARAELVTSSPEAMFRLMLAGDGVGVGYGKGAGDCDCATATIGAMLESIGFKTRMATTAEKWAPPGKLFGHVFIQAQVPGRGWVTVDPVLHPKRPFGATANHSRIAFWDLEGNFLGARGNYTGMNGPDEEVKMYQNIEEYPDYGLGAVVDDEDGTAPVDWSMLGLTDWGYINTPYGKQSAVEMYGIIDGSYLNGLSVEVDDDDEWENGLVRTPMLELSVDDYQYVQANRSPYDGMLGLSDTGEVYHYDGSLGFFKKLFRKVRKKVRKVARRVKKGIKKVLKRSKFGRMLLKIGGKIKKIAMKVVRPLMKFVGKWAAKLAPIAALIPGYGTAIAGALAAAGRVAKTMQKWGVATHGKKGKVRNLKLKDPKKLPGFQKAMRKEAERMKKWGKRNPRKFRALSQKLAKQR